MSIYEQEQSTCACGGSCGCGQDHESDVIELTRDEYVVRLEQYLHDLKAEIEVVERELSALRVPA